jgi:sugar phosphate isomerase/epimerase
LAGRLALVVAADARRARAGRSAERLSVGAGEIDWLNLLENLRDAGYTGWLVVDGEADNPETARKGLAALVRLMGLAGV